MTRSFPEAGACSTLEADVFAMRRDGFLIVPEILSAMEVNALAQELEPWLQRTPRCEGDFHGWRTTRVNALFSKAPSVQILALHPRVLAMAETLIGAHCDCIRLNLTQAIRIHPGERAQAPHRDEEMWPSDPRGQVWSLNVMWAVSDFTALNGATRLWPGSHRKKLGRAPCLDVALAAEMKAGSALIYLGGLTHGGGANQSDGDRTGVVVGYCAGWLRTYEAQFLAYPRQVAAQFSEPLQRLLGYRMHRPNIGAWEGQDPIQYLRGGSVCAPHLDALPPAIAAELRLMMGANGD
jgi:ectoine hydroxylase-related dioxygenase (phytanoyl-CoA dioxygenase family)